MAGFNYKFADLVDIPTLEKILADLYEASRIPSAIIDLEGNLLTGAGWQKICRDFHRKNPEAEKACIKSDTYIRDELQAGEPYAIYECPHGLVDSCCPIIVEGHHLANVFTGQMLHTPLDDEIRDRFRNQARKFGFNEEEYLQALSEVPVFPIEKHKSILEFLSNFAQQVAQMGLTKLKTLEKSRVIQESEEKLRALIETTDTGYVIVDQQGFVLDANQEYVRIAGYQQLDEIIGRNALEWTAEYDLERNKAEVEKCFQKGQVRNLELDYVHPNGCIVPIEINATVIKQGGQTSILTTVRDITERQQSAKSLQESEARLRAIIDNSTIAIYLKDNDHKYLLINRQYEKLAQTTEREIVGKDDYDVFPKEIADLFRGQDGDVREQKRALEFQETITLADGEHTFITSKFPLYGPDGKIYAVGGVCTDITERLHIEEALAKANEEWHYAMDFFEDAIYLIDMDDKLVRANKTFYQMTGLTPEQAIGQDIASIMHPQGEGDPGPVCAARLARKDAVINMEPDNPDNPTGRPIEVTMKIIRDKAEKPIGILMGIRDLSRQREMESVLRRGKEEWETTFDAMSDIITIQNKDMKIIRTNKAAHDFFEVTPGVLNGRYCYEIFRGEDQPCAQCPALETIADCRAHSGIIKHEKLGKTFYVSSAPVFEKNGKIKYLVHVAKDITEQKRLEEELFQSHKMEAIGTLAGGIAHDFNNILSAIIGYSELTMMGLPEDSSNRDNVDQVLKAGIRAKELVKQILSFSRKNNQKLEPFAPSSIIKEALTLMRASLPTTIAIKTEIDPDCGKILADPTNLHQILVNLCTNALHAIEHEKGEIQIKLARQVLTAEDIGGQNSVQPGAFVVLTVSDSGCGIDEATVKRIFEPYFTTKVHGQGTGMGLSVVHGIMQSYGGMIKVASEPGKGTTFNLYFPAIENGVASNIEGKDGTPGSLPRGDERIMVVDDEEAILKMLQIFLETLGYEVTTKVSSVEAFEEFRGNPESFDLILTDQTMPNMTGVDLAKEIMGMKPDIPIILCTGYSSMVTEDAAKEIGIKHFAKKPVDAKALAMMVRQALDN